MNYDYEIKNDRLLREAHNAGRRQGLNEQRGFPGGGSTPTAPLEDQGGGPSYGLPPGVYEPPYRPRLQDMPPGPATLRARRPWWERIFPLRRPVG